MIGCRQGITVTDSVGVEANSNVVQDPEVGLLVEGDSTTASANIVLGATQQALIVRAQNVTLEDNLIGTTSRTGSIQPFEGEGIRFQTGSGSVKDNVIVGADGAGIVVNTSDVVTLRGNRLEAIEQRPIVAPNGPDPPDDHRRGQVDRDPTAARARLWWSPTCPTAMPASSRCSPTTTATPTAKPPTCWASSRPRSSTGPR